VSAYRQFIAAVLGLVVNPTFASSSAEAGIRPEVVES
jgi:hypothetical protein